MTSERIFPAILAACVALTACAGPDDTEVLSESERAIDGCTQLTAAVYHVVNPSNGASLYTASASEASSAATYGFTVNRGVAFKASSSARTGTVPAYRLYRSSPLDFVWSSRPTERRRARNEEGYVNQGVGFHVATASDRCLVPVYRYVHAGLGKHRFAVQAQERQALAAAGWTSEGTVFYAAAAVAIPAPTASTYAIHHDHLECSAQGNAFSPCPSRRWWLGRRPGTLCSRRRFVALCGEAGVSVPVTEDRDFRSFSDFATVPL